MFLCCYYCYNCTVRAVHAPACSYIKLHAIGSLNLAVILKIQVILLTCFDILETEHAQQKSNTLFSPRGEIRRCSQGGFNKIKPLLRRLLQG